MPATVLVLAVTVPPAVPAITLPVTLAGLVGCASVSVYVPAGRFEKVKLPDASVWAVIGELRALPDRVRVTPVIPESGPLAPPLLLKSRNTRPASEAVAGVCWNRPKSTVRLVWASGVFGSVFGFSPVGPVALSAITRLWTDPPEPSG